MKVHKLLSKRQNMVLPQINLECNMCNMWVNLDYWLFDRDLYQASC